MARENTGRDDKIKNLENLCKELENKSCELENKQFQADADLEAFKMNIQMNMRGVSGLLSRVSELEDHDENHDGRIKQLEEDMNDAKNKLLLVGSGGSGDGIDGDALSKMLDNLRDEFGKKFVEKPDHESLKERVEKLEKDSETHGIDIEELKSRPIGGGEGGGIDLSGDEYSLLKKIFATWPDVEKILLDLKELNLGILKDQIKNLEDLQNQKADKTELGPIKDEINTMKDKHSDLQKEVDELKNRLNNLGNLGSDSGPSDAILADISARLQQLENRVTALEKKMANLQ